MKKLFLKFAMLTALCLPTIFVACSSDDNEDNSSVAQDEVDGHRDIDELDILQQNLVRTDSLGNFVSRVFGVCLDKSDSTIVSVGVDSFEEAQQKFQSLFSDTTAIGIDGNRATFTLQDGYVDLVHEDGTNGLVGTVNFNLKGLKYISQINFILNSAWPENANGKGYHKFGTFYEYHGWTGRVSYAKPTPVPDWDEWHKFLCIREYSNGTPALLVAIPDKDYCIAWRNSDAYDGNVPGKKNAQKIQKILKEKWDTFVSLYKTQGTDIDRMVWIDEGGDCGFTDWRYTIHLKTGETDWWDTGNKTPMRHVMFFLESNQVEQ